MIAAVADQRASAAQRSSAGSSQVAYALAGPAFCLLLVLFIVPALSVFLVATSDWEFGAGAFHFVGARNFRELIADSGFRVSLRNTLLYAALVVPLTTCLGFSVALLIEARESLRAFYRAIHFLPFMATLAAMAIAWEGLLHPTIGLVNQWLAAVGVPTANWLRDEHTALPVLAIIGIWQNLGFAMLLFLAGLKTIPQELYDAAEIDGADAWIDRLKTVTLPLIGPVFLFVFIVVSLRALEVFDTVQILTQGGPNHSSEVLLYTLYRECFVYLRTGYGAAITVVFLLLVLAFTLMQHRLMEKRVHYL